MADDDVQLTDLEVIQRYSLAVRGASAPRAELVAALQADLAWLQGGRRAPAKATATVKPAAVKPAADKPAKKAPAKAAASKRRA
jgi:hypothetical protein